MFWHIATIQNLTILLIQCEKQHSFLRNFQCVPHIAVRKHYNVSSEVNEIIRKIEYVIFLILCPKLFFNTIFFISTGNSRLMIILPSQTKLLHTQHNIAISESENCNPGIMTMLKHWQGTYFTLKVWCTEQCISISLDESVLMLLRTYRKDII